MNSRKVTVPADPTWLENEGLAGLWDADPFEDDGEPEATLAGAWCFLTLDELPDVEKACVEMRVIGRMSYGEIARHMCWETGDPPTTDRKAAWRVCARGLRRMREAIPEEIRTLADTEGV